MLKDDFGWWYYYGYSGVKESLEQTWQNRNARKSHNRD